MRQAKTGRRWVRGLGYAAVGAWLGVNGSGAVWAGEGHGSHDTGAMGHEMSVPERGAQAQAPAGVQYQKAGVQLLDHLTDRLDHEIEKAGGNLGGFTSGAQAHAAMQGVPLKVSNEESVTPGGRCPSGAPVKAFDISAINAEITINRFLDYYAGYLYVLTEDLDHVRAEEKKNAAARKSDEEFPSSATSIGLQGDLIQPLAIRANAGDCVRITLRNQTTDDEPVSLHVHGSS